MQTVLLLDNLVGLHSTVGSLSSCRFKPHNFKPQLGHITFMEIDLEMISMAILPLPLIQEGQLSVTDRSMRASTGYLLRGQSLSKNRVSRLT